MSRSVVGAGSPDDASALLLLEGLVRIPSVSGDESRAAQWLVARMNELGYRAWVDEVGNAVGVRGDEAAPALLLLGHIDTVPGRIDVRLEGGELRGRGTVDAKGPLAAFVVAGARARLPSGTRLMVVGAVEEEIATSRGARHIAQQFMSAPPAACIIGEPSGWDGVTIGYKGRLIAEFTLERALGHSARPDETVTEAATAWWEKVRGWAADWNAARAAGGALLKMFDRVQAGLRSINTETDGLHERVRAVVGFRLPPGLRPSEVEDTVRAAAHDVAEDAQVRCSGHEEAVLAERSSPVVGAVTTAIRDVGEASGGDFAGITPRVKVKTGTSDMNVVAAAWGRNVPIVAYGAGDSALDHTPQERIDVRDWLRSIQVLQRVIETQSPFVSPRAKMDAT